MRWGAHDVAGARTEVDGPTCPTDREVCTMAFDTFMVIAGVYPDLESAEADYDLVEELHRGTRRGPASGGRGSSWR